MWIAQAAGEAGVNAQTLSSDERGVSAIAEPTIEYIDRRIARVPLRRAPLDQLVESCRHDGATDCPIVGAPNAAPEGVQ